MPKKFLKKNVYDASCERIRYVFSEFGQDEVWLSFSGGKDSTVCFYLIKEIALSMGIKKINILLIDLEAHYKLHEEFLYSICNCKDIEINGYWVCLPFNLSNASSFYMPKWLCWDDEKKDVWVRDIPSHKMVVNIENNPFGEFFRKGMEFEEFIINFPKFLVSKLGVKKVAQIVGIRTDESFNRYLKLAVKKNRKFYNGKEWILKIKETGVDSYCAHIIYDWRVQDVWRYLSDKNYNKCYDKMYKAGYSLHEMRICQPYGEEQRDNIDLFSKIEPETWDKVINRVNGCNFSKIYKKKNLFKGKISKPKDVSWEQWTRVILNTMPPYLREHFLRRINVFLRWWRKEMYNDIESVYAFNYAENESFDVDGLYKVDIYDQHDNDTKKLVPSWRRIAKVLVKGDYLCKNLTFCANKNEYEKLQNLIKKYEV